MRNKLIAEFIGSYFLYLIIGLCITPEAVGPFTPLAVGIGLAALVYSCGHISKAHFNPATTVTYLCAGTHQKAHFWPFVAVILLGTTLAAFTVPILKPEGMANITTIQIDYPKVILAEFLFTFALMWVILNVAIATGTKGNQFYGIAIGAIVIAGAYTVGPISCAAFNPAVTLALAINGHLPFTALPAYFAIQVIAAAAAGWLFKSMQITNSAEFPSNQA